MKYLMGLVLAAIIFVANPVPAQAEINYFPNIINVPEYTCADIWADYERDEEATHYYVLMLSMYFAGEHGLPSFNLRNDNFDRIFNYVGDICEPEAAHSQSVMSVLRTNKATFMTMLTP